MSTYCAAFASDGEAAETVERLLAAGVPGDDVRVLMSAHRHDPRDEPVGAFAGPGLGAGAPVGRFAGSQLRRDDAMGGFAGDPQSQPVGSFASIDRETVTTGAGAMRQVQDVSHHRLREMLMEAGLDEETAKRDVEALHHGRVLVLVRVPAGAEERVRPLLESPAA